MLRLRGGLLTALTSKQCWPTGWYTSTQHGLAEQGTEEWRQRKFQKY
jgi:hypothetical protein